MSYIDGFLTVTPAAKRDAFVKFSQDAAPLFREFGTQRAVDTWGEDVPKGEVTDFCRALKATDGEVVSFGWMEYPDKATRDYASRQMMEDPRMEALGDMPFDGKRMIFGGFIPVVDEGTGRGAYIDGFVLAVPTAKRQLFIDSAVKGAASFRKHGALRVVECWGDDVPKGEVTDFYRTVQAKDDETVAFSWIEWPDKATRDTAYKAMEPEMEEMMRDNPMPFDGKRMIYGGFEVVADSR